MSSPRQPTRAAKVRAKRNGKNTGQRQRNAALRAAASRKIADPRNDPKAALEAVRLARKSSMPVPDGWKPLSTRRVRRRTVRGVEADYLLQVGKALELVEFVTGVRVYPKSKAGKASGDARRARSVEKGGYRIRKRQPRKPSYPAALSEWISELRQLPPFPKGAVLYEGGEDDGSGVAVTPGVTRSAPQRR